MFVVMDLRTVWILADVYERDLAQVAVGSPVAARVPAWPERTFDGTIASIGATVDRRSRTVKVRVVLANADGALKPGMFAKRGGEPAPPASPATASTSRRRGPVADGLRLPIDAVPDVTNVQVQILTKLAGARASEVERFVTTPVERR
jgi:multidrug efflux pump subunit AcrA (membrane-fusion protein)